jgi:hypothetical protein
MTRSLTVSARLDPKLHHLANLAARKQRRSLSSFLEWVVRESLERNSLADNGISVADEADLLWHEDEATRLYRLAVHHPDLLTQEEELIWKRAREELERFPDEPRSDRSAA